MERWIILLHCVILSFMENILSYAQIIISTLLITVILLQQGGGGLGGAFGGGDSITHTKRGSDKYLFISTIVLSVLFFASALAGILL